MIKELGSHEGIDLYIPMGTYDLNDTSKHLLGEPCKALVNYGVENIPLGIHALKQFGNLEEVRKIIINGPKDKLEEMISSYSPHLPDKEIIVVNESAPGDTKVACLDGLRNIGDASLGLTDYVLVALSDFAKINEESARIIFNDFSKAVYADIEKGERTDIYWAVGNELDDNGAYGRIRDHEIDRKGFILGPSKAVRFGGNILVRRNAVHSKEQELENLVQSLDKRKIKENKTETGKYWLGEFINNGSKEDRNKKIFALAKGGINYIKKHGIGKRDSKLSNTVKGILSVIPYGNIDIGDANNIISDTFGINLKFVETIGSADVDNDLEFEAAQESLFEEFD